MTLIKIVKAAKAVQDATTNILNIGIYVFQKLIHRDGAEVKHAFLGLEIFDLICAQSA